MRFAGFAAAFGVVSAVGALAMADAPRSPAPAAHWVVSWAASPQPATHPLELGGQTVRQIVHLSLGGARVRVRLSNAYGSTPLRVDAAHVATRARGAAIVAGSDRPLTFAGARAVTIAPGAQLLSDPVELAVAAGGDLAVSLYSSAKIAATTEHADAQQTTYVSAVGDFSGAVDFAAARSTHSWYFLSGVDVEAADAAKAVVVLGDSLTDGRGSTLDANHRWPDFLSARLNARSAAAPRAVVNAGISGNGLSRKIIGAAMGRRFDVDVLAQSGVGYMVLLAGVNDIIQPTTLSDPAVSAEQLIAAARQLAERAHAHGLKVLGGTLTPFDAEGPDDAPYESKRQALNQWIRTGGAFDAVVDFDRVIRDPARPSHVLRAFDSGDHLHPNDAGYRAMADAVELTTFAP
jgi:lysophospholipase L1-like esterase